MYPDVSNPFDHHASMPSIRKEDGGRETFQDVSSPAIPLVGSFMMCINFKLGISLMYIEENYINLSI